MARKLLLQLSIYFRSNMQGARQLLIPMQKEIQHVEAYLSLEQARFPNRYHVTFQIEKELEQVMIPPFVLQVLVENAVRHAFPKHQKNCEVIVSALMKDGHVYMKVTDNGQGIDDDKMAQLLKAPVESLEGTGTALFNLDQRLRGIFGRQAALSIYSDQGTDISFRIPMDYVKRMILVDESINRR